MKDINGQEICGYQIKIISLQKTAYITIKDHNGKTYVIATIKVKIQFDASADIYLHNPPVDIDYVTTNGMPVSITVEGDILARKYDFMMGNPNTNPFKIAKAVRKFKWLRERLSKNDTYFLEIGPNVDAAFICICSYALDELFTD